MKKIINKLLLFVVLFFSLTAFLSFVKADEEITSITINSYFDTVYAGSLNQYLVTTNTPHASIEDYGSNTTWAKWELGQSSWHGFGEDPLVAVADGTTHYALRIWVDLDDGYSFAENAVIIFNNEEYSEGYTTISRFDNAGIVYIDLGLAQEEEPEEIYSVTYDYNGGNRNGEASYTVQSVAVGMELTEENLMEGVTAPEGKELYAILVDGERQELGYSLFLDHNVIIQYLWRSIDSNVITSVDLIGIVKPVEGATPSVSTLQITTPGVNINNAHWYEDSGTWSEDGPTSRFFGSKRYILIVVLDLEEGYEFMEDFDEDNFTLNENPLKAEYVRSGPDIRIYYEASVAPKITSAPNIKVANANNNTILVSWNDLTNAAKYEVYRSANNKSFSKVGTVTTNRFTDKGLVYGKKYYYKVKAINSISNKTSSVVSGKTIPNKVNLSITSASTNNIKLSWDKVSVTGYEVYMGTKTSNMKKITTITKNSTLTYNKTKLKSNTTYYFKVRAYKTVSGTKVYGPWSGIVNTKTAPEKPSFTISIKEFNALNLKVGSVTGAKKYVIQKLVDGAYQTIEELTSARTISQEGLETGVVYTYRVRACNPQNRCSGWVSVSKKQTTKVPNLTLASTTTKKVRVSFSYVNEADGYEVYRSTKKSSGYTLNKTILAEDDIFSYDDKTKKGYTYYYKVRSYKIIDGKKVYSDFKLKSIKSK